MKTSKNWLPTKEFKYIFSKIPRLCVDIVVLSDEGILLTKRGMPPNKGFWHIPGGGVLKGETLEEAVKRVAKDELGVDVKIKKVLGTVEFLKPSPHHHAVAVSHFVEIVKGKIKRSKQNHGFKFFKKLPEKIEPEHKKFIIEKGLLRGIKGYTE